MSKKKVIEYISSTKEKPNLVKIDVNNPIKKTTLFEKVDNLEKLELGFEGIINCTKYKIKASIKELVLRYFDWYEMIQTVDDKGLNDECIILESGE